MFFYALVGLKVSACPPRMAMRLLDGLVLCSLLLCLFACGTDSAGVSNTQIELTESLSEGAVQQDVTAAAQAQASSAAPKPELKAAKDGRREFETIQWTDLIPGDDLEALLNPPDYLAEIEDGSEEDQISGSIQMSKVDPGEDRYQQALVSTQVIDEMDGRSVRIPGFIVPLEFDDEQTITQFFLVPFFGACIHVPPPPPNQIILVNYAKGLKLTALYDPFWISGEIKTSLIENNLATAAYVMEMHAYEAYTDY